MPLKRASTSTVPEVAAEPGAAFTEHKPVDRDTRISRAGVKQAAMIACAQAASMFAAEPTEEAFLAKLDELSTKAARTALAEYIEKA